MINDPIVEEVHKTRQALLDACDGDLEKLMDRFQALEDRDRDRLVTSTSSAQIRSAPQGQPPQD